MKFITLLVLPGFIFGQIKLDQKILLVDKKVEISAPKELKKMSDEMWSAKYQNRTRPILVLTDENGEINLIADMTQQTISGNQLAEFKDAQIAQLKKKRSDLVFLDQGIKVVDGKKIGYFKFISQAIDQKVFNYYFFKVVNGKVLLFSFNCIEKLQGTWEKIADEIVASIRVK